MTSYNVGYFVGSLSTTSINRLLFKALIRLAPPELQMTEIAYKDLPLYNRDHDADYPPVARSSRMRSLLSTRSCHHAGVQPFDSRSPEERDRLGEPSLRHERVHTQAVGGERDVSRKDWHRDRAAASAEHLELLQFTADEFHRGLHPVRA